MHEAFSFGARGECVARLQEALRIPADGIFGPQTYEAVCKVENTLARPQRGLADEEVFRHLGIPWPTEFERVLALIVELEGTSYGDCNAMDIDGAGLTIGICGFTTRHGEVQALVESFLAACPEAWTWAAPSLQRALRQLMDESAPVEAWESVLLDRRRRPRPATRSAFAAWATHPKMRELQREWAYQRFWIPAKETAKRLGVDTPQGRGLLFDVAVQNGGWRPAHENRLAQMCGKDRTAADTLTVLRAIALAVAAEAKAPWRADVLSRKMLFARGTGVVHSVFYSLGAQAILCAMPAACPQGGIFADAVPTSHSGEMTHEHRR